MFYIPQDDRKARDAWKSETDPIRRSLRRSLPFAGWGEQKESPKKSPGEPTDDFFNTLRGAHPDHWIFQNSVATKRLKDLLRDAQSAQETTPDEDAMLKQGRQEGQAPLRGEKPVRAGADYTPPQSGQSGGATFRGPSKDPFFGEDEELQRDEGGAMRLTRHRRL